MKIEEAYRILGVRSGDSPEIIRRKYHQLMHRHHPDASGKDNLAGLETSQKLNEAFRMVKKENFLIQEKALADWGIRENPAAYCERRIFMEDDLFGEEIIIDTGITGRFYWDPEMEPFSLLLKSLGEAAGELLRKVSEESQIPPESLYRIRAKLLHLLLQEYIDPVKCLQALYPPGTEGKDENSALSLRCHLKLDVSGWGGDFTNAAFSIKEQDSKLYAYSGGRKIGQLTFEENHLYYLVTPLVLQSAAEAVLRAGEVKAAAKRSGQKSYGHISEKKTGNRNAVYLPCELYLNVKQDNIKDKTEEINKEITDTLKRCGH